MEIIKENYSAKRNNHYLKKYKRNPGLDPGRSDIMLEEEGMFHGNKNSQ